MFGWVNRFTRNQKMHGGTRVKNFIMFLVFGMQHSPVKTAHGPAMSFLQPWKKTLGIVEAHSFFGVRLADRSSETVSTSVRSARKW